MSRIVLYMQDQITWEADPSGRIKFMSAAIERWIGRTAADMLGDNWRNVVHGDDADRVFRTWSQVIEQQRKLEIQFAFEANRRRIPVVARAYPQHDDSGEFAGWVGLMIREEVRQ
jgi:PAS domain S-box-containing protein